MSKKTRKRKKMLRKLMQMADYCRKKSIERDLHTYCVTSSADAEYVDKWLKTHEVPINGMYLNKSICDAIDYKDFLGKCVVKRFDDFLV